MTKRYWKTTATTTILTEGDAPPTYEDMDGGLDQVAYDITYSDASGVTKYLHEEVTEEQMRLLLLEQGTAPSFLLEGDADEVNDGEYTNEGPNRDQDQNQNQDQYKE